MGGLGIYGVGGILWADLLPWRIFDKIMALLCDDDVINFT